MIILKKILSYKYLLVPVNVQIKPNFSGSRPFFVTNNCKQGSFPWLKRLTQILKQLRPWKVQSIAKKGRKPYCQKGGQAMEGGRTLLAI